MGRRDRSHIAEFCDVKELAAPMHAQECGIGVTERGEGAMFGDALYRDLAKLIDEGVPGFRMLIPSPKGT